jgi:anion-transporting  ArsA/GET3 family ATPase
MVAGQAVDQIVAAEERRIQQAQAAQDTIDQVVDQTRDRTEEYRAVTKEIDGLVVYNTLLDRQIADQNQELTNLRTSIDSVTVIERQILPLLTRMIDGLERFVALDMPFLADERASRVDSLNALLGRADVTAAEKFRVVMEAWQIENEYGRTIEAYTGELQIDGNNREVDFLRIGRVALLYQTPDGVNSGAWDQTNRQWVTVGTEYRNSIRQGLRLARNQIGPDLLLLPIAAPEEG